MPVQVNCADRRGRRPGFTIPELLVVAGIIVVLMAMLLPALSGGYRTASMVKSMNNLRQIGIFLQAYAKDNREFIVPSRFDYSDDAIFTFKGKVRAPVAHDDPADEVDPELGDRHEGTWSDILWTVYKVGSIPSAVNPDWGATVDHDYSVDSPDTWAYQNRAGEFENPFRSSAPNSRDFIDPLGTDNKLPKPFGTGAHEAGYAGYFAANNFFNARPDAPDLIDPDDGSTIPTPAIGRWYVTGQIRAPERSMYLVDSYAGETIEPVAEPYNNDFGPTGDLPTIEVDFRYNGACLMLFLDGHTSPESPWKDLCDLEENRRIRVLQLDRRSPNMDGFDCP